MRNKDVKPFILTLHVRGGFLDDFKEQPLTPGDSKYTRKFIIRTHPFELLVMEYIK